jgi:hypothetical protein
MVYTFQGQYAENVFYFRDVDGWTADKLGTLNNKLFLAWQTHIRTTQSSALTLTKLKATDVSVEGGAYNELAPTSGNVGTEAAPPTALGSTVAIKFATGLSGRSNRGRMFFIGLTEDATNGNLLTTGYGASLAGAYSALFADVLSGTPGAQHVVVSYCHNGAWRTTAVVNDVTAYSADDIIDSQRRRLTGRGL